MIELSNKTKANTAIFSAATIKAMATLTIVNRNVK